MENVRVVGNKCVLRINSQIYPPHVVLKAAEAFKLYGDVAVEENNTQVVINPKNVSNTEEIGYEFFDCLLSIIQNLDV